MTKHLTVEAVRNRLQVEVDRAGSQYLWATPRGIYQSDVSRFLSGKTDRPAPALLEALGLERQVLFVEKASA